MTDIQLGRVAPYTRQEAFEKALLHMQKQGMLAVADVGDALLPSCVYLNDEGCRCAIGALLDDKEIAMAKDVRGSVDTLCNENPITFAWLREDREFYWALQCKLHDDNRRYAAKTFADFLSLGAKSLAKDFKLEMPEGYVPCTS